MRRTAPRTASVLPVLIGLLVAAAVVLLPSTPAEAASKGRVRGYVAAQGGVPLKVSWFTADWKYLGSRPVARSGIYGLALKPGTYRLQFTDKRPSYDVTKLAASDATVVVRTGRTAIKNVRMHRGAAITGTVRAGGRPGAHATVIAANVAEQSFSTVANEKGQFAIGGLPKGSYSVFTYDRKKSYVAKSTYVPGLKPGRPQNLAIRLKQRAGDLIVDLRAGSSLMTKPVTVTAVSRRTGQFWTVRARHGTAVFKGLYPGRYKLVSPGYGEYLARTGAVSGSGVHAGRPSFGSFRLTEHGGAFTGRLLAGDDGTPVAKATVQLYDRAGSVVAVATTAADGRFRIGGRLGTTNGLTLSAFDRSTPDFFDDLEKRGLSIRINQTRALGDLTLPAKPSAVVTGTVVDAYNIAIPLAGASVQLLNAKGSTIGATTSAGDGSFTIDKRLLAQGLVSVVVAPTGSSAFFGTGDTRCEYTSSNHGGITLEAGMERDLGLVGMMRKANGTCQAPLGDHVIH